jgi:hypothetical protein
MKRALTVLYAASLALSSTPAPGTAAEDYRWSISRSSTDPSDNTGPLQTGGQAQLYLWLECSLAGGVSAMEAEITGTLAEFFVEYTPIHRSFNFGSSTTLQLGIWDCPTAPTLIGALNFLVFSQGDVCLAPSAERGLNVSVDCSPKATQWPHAVAGYSGIGTPCDVGRCEQDSVATESGTGEAAESPQR